MFIQNEKYVSKGMAISAIVFIVLSILMLLTGVLIGKNLYFNVVVQDFQQTGTFSGWNIFENFDIREFFGTAAILIIGGLFALISQIFQVIVIYKWSRAINTNIDNTRFVFNELKKEVKDKSKNEALDILNFEFSTNKVQDWAYWIYFAMLIIAFFSLGSFAWAAPIGVIFLAIYIHSIFSISKSLQETKTHIYNFLGKRDLSNNKYIKDRNVGLFILFIIITFGIYWLYLIIKLSDEINDYLSWDIKTRENLLKDLKEKN